jgi:DNA-binding IclR family transcriptional regulator
MANPAPRRPRSEAAPSGSPQATVTSKALALLGAFETAGPRLSLSAMARRAGLPVATAHRLAGELTEWGALDRVGSEYVVGHRLWRLGLLAPVQQDIAEIAAPFMQDVLFVTQNVVNLFTVDAAEALLVERIAGTRVGQPFRRVGARLPLHASAAGKVFLAFGPSSLAASLPRRLTALTPHTTTDRTVLEAELVEVRAKGYATTTEEAGVGNYALAVPVLQANGTAVAALGVVTQGTHPSIGSVVPVLRIAARGIARRLGSGPGGM